MPKIGGKKKKGLSSMTVNFIILFLMLAVLGAGMYFFYYYYLQIKSSEVEALAESRAQLTMQKIVKDLDMAGLVESGFYDLKQHGVMEYGRQLKAVPTDRQRPLAPENARVINPGVGEELIIMWQKPEAALFEEVVVYRSEAPGELGRAVAENMPAAGYFIDAEIDSNTAYYYTVRSVNEGRESGNTAQLNGVATDFTPPFPPRGVAVADTEESALVVSWNDPPDKDFAYCRVYRSRIPGMAGEMVADQVTAGEYRDKDVSDGTDYYYMVTSVDKAGNESSSALSAPPAGNPAPFGNETREPVAAAE